MSALAAIALVSLAVIIVAAFTLGKSWPRLREELREELKLMRRNIKP